MVEAGGIGKGGWATAAEEMDSTDSGGNGDQAAAANCGSGDRRRAAAAADIVYVREDGWAPAAQWAAELGGAAFVV